MTYVRRFVVWRHGWLSVFAKPDILGIVDGDGCDKIDQEILYWGEGSYLSSEIQLVYSKASANWFLYNFYS